MSYVLPKVAYLGIDGFGHVFLAPDRCHMKTDTPYVPQKDLEGAERERDAIHECVSDISIQVGDRVKNETHDESKQLLDEIFDIIEAGPDFDYIDNALRKRLELQTENTKLKAEVSLLRQGCAAAGYIR